MSLHAPWWHRARTEALTEGRAKVHLKQRVVAQFLHYIGSCWAYPCSRMATAWQTPPAHLASN